MTEPGARVLADSISPWGDRLTSFEVVMHRFVLSEFNTHRAFTRSSASSRAVPVAKMLARVREDPAIPLVFPYEKPGMQGGEELGDADRIAVMLEWRHAAMEMADYAEGLAAWGVHKSVTNRLLEPFMWHTVVVTSTTEGLLNFWNQRCSPLAQPEIRAVAEAMRVAWLDSNPEKVDIGGWHTPYVDKEEKATLKGQVALQVSVARCARVSTGRQGDQREAKEDVEFYDRLITAEPPHAAPLEHVATPKTGPAQTRGNFDGWVQLRHLVL